MENLIFLQIGLIIIVAGILAYISRLLKQPPIPAYIIAGMLIGPIGNWVTDTEVIASLSEIGIAFLLFIVGLEINFKKLKNVAFVSTIGGLAQSLILFTFGFLVANLFGIFTPTQTVFVGVILAFSSTMVVMKLLSDKKELDTLHGRMVVGFLLMEDILAIIAISMVASKNLSFFIIGLSFVKVVFLIAISVVLGKYILPPIFSFAAKKRELLFLTSITFCFMFGLFASYLELSIAIGAFIAGVALGNLHYNIEIIGKVKSLRDFFSTIFFVSLGMELPLRSIGNVLLPLIVFLFFIIIVKPIITMFICSFFGYRKKPSFLTAISLSQTSEFSLIIAAMALNYFGAEFQDIFSLAVLLAVITMAKTSYFIKFDKKIYSFMSKYLDIFDRCQSGFCHEFEYLPKRIKKSVILCGYNRLGYSIYKTLKKMKKKTLIIDYDPELIRKLIASKVPCIYGDIEDIEVLDRLDFKNAEMVISTIPDDNDNVILIRKTREVNKSALIFVTANHVEEALSLYDEGADYVILPHYIGGDHASVLIEEYTIDVDKIIERKLAHIKELHKRKKLPHEHPVHRKENGVGK